MAKLLKQYGQDIQPNNVYMCDTVAEMMAMTDLHVGDSAIVLHYDADAGESFMYMVDEGLAWAPVG